MSIKTPTGGDHRIVVEGNDGYRLYLDGALVIDDWIKRSCGRRTVEIPLMPGSRHNIRLEIIGDCCLGLGEE